MEFLQFLYSMCSDRFYGSSSLPSLVRDCDVNTHLIDSRSTYDMGYF